ncbi:MAG: GIY-YIG nuclease family protein [Eubacteriaceae bacterium]|nr:GIY-YIG nuclease family protein [Eubacteriaceae bacterium]
MLFKNRNFVYMLKCADGTLYTGWTNDIAHRLVSHRNGTASKYTASRRPVMLFYLEECKDRSQAMKREIEIKKLSRKVKLAMGNVTAEMVDEITASSDKEEEYLK